MTDVEILQKAIEKAIGNGFILYKPPYEGEIEKWRVIDTSNPYISIFIHRQVPTQFDGDYVFEKKLMPFEVIFNHSFAKAFWGEYWMPRLQAQVVEKDPIRYLEKFL